MTPLRHSRGRRAAVTEGALGPTLAPESTPRHGGSRPRLILVDDHRLIVEALSRFLSQEYEIAGVAFSGDELFALLPQRPADCLLLDLGMPGKEWP